MDILRKSEVLLMQEDVLAYGYEKIGLPYIPEDDPVDARRLFTSSIGEAILRFRNANERAYISNIRKQTVKRLLEPSSRMISEFARGQIDSLFTNRMDNFVLFFRYLAFILDLSVFAHRYKKVHLMIPVLRECEIMYDAYLPGELAVPFWSKFMSLCNEVLNSSSEHGRPVRHFRNPAIYWDPRDPTFNPDDPIYDWDLPNLRLPPDHPILRPDRHALMKRFWSDVKSSKRPLENDDEGEEYLNLGVETLNLDNESSNVIVVDSVPGASNLVVVESVPAASNLVVVKSDPGASNLVVVQSDPRAEDLNSGANSSTGDENLNVGAENTGHGDDNSNRAENPSVREENPNNPNEDSRPGAENTAENPHPFDVLVAAMQWDIQDILWNTDPNDPAFD